MQTVSSINSPGIFVLEAPMGAGKTEAALVAAEIFAYNAKRTGVFFALPTQATSDGIFTRILDWVNNLDDGSHSIKLAHGKAQFNEAYQALNLFEGSTNVGEDEDGAMVHVWFEGQKKTMLADFVVGTIDQLLLAALRQKHVMLRHLGLSGKVVVIDECHAYDVYMSQYLAMALRWLGAYHVPVIVLSATLPNQKRQMVINAYLGRESTEGQENSPAPEWIARQDYPLVTYTDGGAVKQQAVETISATLEVDLEYLAEAAIPGRLEDLLSDGGCAGVVVNTVGRAQVLVRTLRERFGKDAVRLHHSLFLSPDRIEKEKILLEELGKKGERRPVKLIVVGTQVLEQSLDIDFDVVITDICPMDLLLQRIGRLHRHTRTRPAKLSRALCLITGLDGDGFDAGAKAVYGEYLLMRTKALLTERIAIPRDIPSLVQGVYDEERELSPAPPGYFEAKQKWERMIEDKEKRACDFRISPPSKRGNIIGWLNTDVSGSDKRGEAAVRDTDESIEIMLVQEKDGGRVCFLPWEENGREIRRNETPEDELAQKLARQSVRLPHALCAPWNIAQTIDEIERLNMERLPMWQASSWLNGGLFLILDSNLSATLCGYRLTYDPDDGLLYKKEEDSGGKKGV
jgi:CRISPR-associated endonuclease/helicase Cas3